MKTCKIKNCDKVRNCRGYCRNHYRRYMEGQRGSLLSRPVRTYTTNHTPKICIVRICGEKNYGNGYCQKHHAILWKSHRRQERKLQLLVAFGEKCKDCAKTYSLCAFDFDNIEDPQDHTGIAKLITYNASWERIAEEVAKCDLVCANCHRVRTQTRHHKRWSELGV